MDFFTPGEKVKRIRKQLGMTQLELEDVNLKRNFISMIENGDRCASRKTARTLARKFNERAKELGLVLNVDEDYLLSSQREQAEIYCRNKLNEITNLEDFEEINSIASEYELEEIEFDLYIKKGNILINRLEYNDAFINFLRALDICKNLRNWDKQAMVFNKLGVCKVEVGEYSESLEYYSKAYHYSSLHNIIKIIKYSLYNIAFVYSKQEKYDKVIEYIDELMIYCDKASELGVYVHGNVLKSIALREKYEVDSATKLLEDLVPLCRDNEELLGYIYNNLGSTYLKIKGYEEALKYYEDAQVFINKFTPYHIHGNLIEKAQVYEGMGNYNEAIKLVEEGMKMAEEYRDVEYLVKGYEMLVELYKHDNNGKRLEKLCINLLETTQAKRLNIDRRSIYSRLAFIHLNDNEIEKSKEYIRLSLNEK